jgi:hypothetical protein
MAARSACAAARQAADHRVFGFERLPIPRSASIDADSAVSKPCTPMVCQQTDGGKSL